MGHDAARVHGWRKEKGPWGVKKIRVDGGRRKKSD
jgi:hypothetical protein